ncbi:MAG TPA: hypothetical protein VMC08_02335 [Bacteroidales bacterium]|nr:hypothetical protein [Bacteroidales bacterium]
MKKILPALILSLLGFQAFSQTTEVVSKKEFQDEKKKINLNIDQAKKAGLEAKKLATRQAALVDSLKTVVKAGQATIAGNADSLAAAKATIQVFQHRLDRNKTNSRIFIGVTYLLALILFVVVFLLLFRFRSQLKNAMELLGKKEETMEKEAAALKEANRLEHDKLTTLAGDIKQKLQLAVEQEEKKEQELAAQIDVLLKSLNEKSQALLAAMDELKAEHGKKLLQHDQKVKEIGSSLEIKGKEVEKQKEIHGVLVEEFKSFRISLEKEIKKLTEELASHIHSKS